MHTEYLRKRVREELGLLADYHRENEEIDLRFVYVHALTLVEHIDALTYLESGRAVAHEGPDGETR